MKRLLLAVTILFTTPVHADTNYHLVGWANTFAPGAGRAMMGEYGTGAIQAGYEIGAFGAGYALSNGSVLTLDGFTSRPPTRRIGGRTTEVGIENQFYGDMLQEFGIKAHMVNTYEAYRLAAFRAGVHENIDEMTALDLFKEPFNPKNLTNPLVYLPLAFVLGTTIADYADKTSGPASPVSRLTPYSNFLYAVDQGLATPIGSGAPEEMFYRGFVQNEAMALVPSPYFAIPVSTALFTFSHAPGDGRPQAAVAGGYLGFLAYHYNGRLGPGITLHFWSEVILGLESILLSHKGQRTTPPASFSVQVNY